MQEHLCVAGSAKAGAFALQLRPELKMVEYLAVLHHADIASRGQHRLIAMGEVDDCQAPGSQSGRTVDMRSAPVGATVHHRAIHRLQPPSVRRTPA